MDKDTIEPIWLHSLLKDLQITLEDKVTLYSHNQSALHIANNLVFHKRTKNVERDCHMVGERVISSFLKTLLVATQHQLADLLTKPFTGFQFNHLLSKMRIHHIYSPS